MKQKIIYALALALVLASVLCTAQDAGLQDRIVVESQSNNALGIIIVVMAFLFLLGMLFMNYFKRIFFVSSHNDVVHFISSKLDKKHDYKAVKAKLVSRGWDAHAVDRAHKEAKALK